MTENVPATLESIITARIGPIIGEMIPEQTLRDTVKRTLDEFMRIHLPELLKKELTARCTKIIQDELNGPGYQDMWNGQRQLAGPKLQEMIRELVPDIVVAAMAAPFSSLRQQMQYNLQQIAGRGY